MNQAEYDQHVAYVVEQLITFRRQTHKLSPLERCTQELAEAILQLRLQIEGFAGEWMLVCKGYDEDWDNYTEIDTGDLDTVAEGAYDYFQLWPIENAGERRTEYGNAFDDMAGHPMKAIDTMIGSLRSSKEDSERR